jgi:ribosomal protein S8
MANRPWTEEEDQALIQYFNTEGWKGVSQRTGRSCGGINARIRDFRNEGVDVGLVTTEKNRYDYSLVDDEIIRIYKGKVIGGIRRLSKKTGIPVSSLKARARKLKLPRFYNWNTTSGKMWRAEEDEIIEKYGERSISRIQDILKNAGYIRSISAIETRVTKFRIRTGRIDLMTAADVAGKFGVDPKVVISWIDNGNLKASREAMTAKTTGQKENLCYWIKASSIKKFMQEYPEFYDHTRLTRDSWIWAVELLSGSIFGGIQHSCGVEGAQEYSTCR